MRKFNTIFLLLLTIFIVFGLTVFFISDTDPFKNTPVPEMESMSRTPGYSTMMTVASIVEDEISEEVILDLQVSPEDGEEHVSLKLLSDEILTEENLLKSSYPILLQSSEIENLSSFSISWHLENDLTVMSFTLDKADLSNMMLENYATIPSIAEDYYKHESMN
ncbi:hypothetical protein [Ureibacillus acetophenoni]|uniref:Uncharacterized protein n=1 Tax=Ureibacillus acetophenoni TaxID=614649 RepID=A0A285TZL8_9BACL|nr:hypothetical protein [Ureibacillus acetophenoni]SOC35134.1 hypothetical protein SAMN05877842_101272 [Ureibacillus acetophenoni]